MTTLDVPTITTVVLPDGQSALLADVARHRLLARRGNQPVHRSTVCYWITKGCRLPTGEVVKLKAVRLGNKSFLVTEAWLQEFAEKTVSAGVRLVDAE